MDFPDERAVKHTKRAVASLIIATEYVMHVNMLRTNTRNHFTFERNGRGSTGLPFWRISKYKIGDR
jgi:hypothetical protein